MESLRRGAGRNPVVDPEGLGGLVAHMVVGLGHHRVVGQVEGYQSVRVVLLIRFCEVKPFAEELGLRLVGIGAQSHGVRSRLRHLHHQMERRMPTSWDLQVDCIGKAGGTTISGYVPTEWIWPQVLGSGFEAYACRISSDRKACGRQQEVSHCFEPPR